MAQTDALNRTRFSVLLGSFDLCETKRILRPRVEFRRTWSFLRERHTTPMETAQNIIHSVVYARPPAIIRVILS